MRRRQAIIIELQERIRKIRREIASKEAEKQTKVEEFERTIQGYQEDLEFNLVILHKFGVEYDYEECDSEEFEAISEEAEEQEVTGLDEAVKVKTGLADSERSPQKITKAQYQEQKEKARAWELDRKREREKKNKNQRPK